MEGRSVPFAEKIHLQMSAQRKRRHILGWIVCMPYDDFLETKPIQAMIDKACIWTKRAATEGRSAISESDGGRVASPFLRPGEPTSGCARWALVGLFGSFKFDRCDG